MDVFITVDKQKLYCDDIRNITAGTQKFILFNFLLSEEWKKLTVYAQFSQNGRSYNVYLNSNDSVYLPPEIGQGICCLALKGTKNDVIAVTKPLYFKIMPNPVHDGAESTGITLTLYEQLVNKVNELLLLKDISTPEAYGAFSDGIHDDSQALKSALESGNLVVLTNDLYIFSDVTVTDHNVRLDGNGHTIHLYGASLNFIASSWLENERPDVIGQCAIVTEKETIWEQGGADYMRTYQRGYLVYKGQKSLNETYTSYTVRYFNDYSVQIKNVNLNCKNVSGKYGIWLVRMVNSLIENVSVVHESEAPWLDEGRVGICAYTCINLIIQGCYVEGWANYNTWKESDEGYGIQVSGDNIHVDNCSGRKCKHVFCGVGARSFWSTNITVSNCNFYLNFVYVLKSNGSTVYREPLNFHGDAYNVTINNVNIYVDGERQQACYPIVIRCPSAVLSNINVYSDGGKIGFGEFADCIYINNLNAPNCTLRTSFDGDSSNAYIRELHINGGTICRIENDKIRPGKVYLEGVTVRELIDNLQFLRARNCIFLRDIDWHSKPTITMCGESILSDCIIYGQKESFVSKNSVVIKAPKNSVHMRDCKIYKRTDDKYKTFSSEQNDVSGCWYEDVLGFYLDTQGILDTNNLF